MEIGLRGRLLRGVRNDMRAVSVTANSVDRFAPHILRDYALLADGERGALVGPRGEIVWMCAPRWACDAIFASLIGGQGVYAVTPATRFVWGGYYEAASLIWRSRWITHDGVIECREALAFPGDPHRAVLLRRILARDATAKLKVILDLRAGFGRKGMRALRYDDRGAWLGRLGDLYLRWSGQVRGAQVERAGRGSALVADLIVPPGTSQDLMLEVSDQPLSQDLSNPEGLWRVTQSQWAETVPLLGGIAARRDARQAYAVLRGLTSSAGGMVAAATTSLPERAQEGRNYDYRYAWIRDQAFAGQAAAAAAAWPLLDDAVRFISARLHADGPRLAPAYTVTGGPVPNQRRLKLPGYPGGFDLVGATVPAIANR